MRMETGDALLETRLATTEQDLLGAQRLRYRVFVEELGGDGDLVDHRGRFERDRFDPYFDHLVLVDTSRRPESLDHVIGVYRLLGTDNAREAGQFYSEDEFDIGPLVQSGRALLELGRSCVDSAHRTGIALFHLWTGVAQYVEDKGIEVLFGVASFHGADVARHAEALSLLHDRYLAPPDLRPRSRAFQQMDLVAPEGIDRRRAMVGVPSLIKAYLRAGGYVGEGAFVDHSFNTIDVCLVMDTALINARSRSLYAGGA